jgi:hypothetical protein
MISKAKKEFETQNNLNSKGNNFIFFCVLILVLISGVSFLIIFKINNAVNYYLDVRTILKSTLGADLTPSTSLIFIFALIGTVGIFVGLILNIIFGFNIFKNKIELRTRHIVMTALFITSIVCIFLIGISEFNYARLKFTFDVVSNDALRDSLSLNDNESIKKISSYHSGHPYGWTNTRTTWWLVFGRLTLIIVGYLTFDSIFVNEKSFAKEVSRNIESSVKKSNIGKSKFNRFLAKIFAQNEKVIACWILIVTILVLIPEIVYAILLTLENSEISKLLEWTLVGKDLIVHEQGMKEFADKLSQVSNSNSLILINIPIMLVGISLTTSIAFVFNIVREWKTDSKLFIVQIIISLIEVVTTLIFGAVSKGNLNTMIGRWNNEDMYSTINSLDQNKLADVVEFFPMPTFNSAHEINHLWLYGFEYISEFVVSFFFVGACYAILIHKMGLVIKLQKTERQKIIDNQAKLNVEIAK